MQDIEICPICFREYSKKNPKQKYHLEYKPVSKYIYACSSCNYGEYLSRNWSKDLKPWNWYKIAITRRTYKNYKKVTNSKNTKKLDFDESVWQAISKIPKGKVASYVWVARACGRPTAARAVANACGRNQKLIIIPCHRVVKSDGTIGGYSGPGGVKQKIKLLKGEGVDTNNLKDYFML